jgi:hypothetical protein
MFKCILSFILTLSFCLSMYGQSKTDSTYKRFRTSALPVVFYSPETRLGLGAAAIIVFRIGKDTATRKSNIVPYVVYTVNHQILTALPFTLFGKKEKWRSEGELTYYLYPEYYYGIGNSTKLEDKDLYSYRWMRVYHRTLLKVKPDVFAGIVQEIIYMGNVRSSSTGKLQMDKPAGYQGSFISGLGPCLVIDKRDNVLNASKGYYLEVFGSLHGKATLSDYNYSRSHIDFRCYKKTGKRILVATQVFARFSRGNIPFKQLSDLGGDQIMRGYYKGRYRDNHLGAAQVELRWNVWRRWGLAFFGGLGKVANRYSDFAEGNWKTSYGGGLRFKIDRKENYNLRLDVGIGRDMTGLYLSFAEAF